MNNARITAFLPWLLAAAVTVSACAHAAPGAPSPALKAEQTGRIYEQAKLWKYADELYGAWEAADGLDWDMAFAGAAVESLGIEGERAYEAHLSRLLAKLGDGHSKVGFFNEKAFLPVSIAYTDGRFYVDEVRQAAEGIPLYSEVVEVNGVPILQYLERELMPLSGSKMERTAVNVALERLVGGGQEGQQLLLRIRTPAGETEERALFYGERGFTLVYSARERPKGSLPIVKEYYYTSFYAYELENAYFVLTLKDFQNIMLKADFVRFMEREDEQGATVRERGKGFILDCRGNSGGNTSYYGTLTREEKLLGLAVVWKRALDFYCGWGEEISPEDWDERFMAAIGPALSAPDMGAYFGVLRDYVSVLGHGSRITAPAVEPGEAYGAEVRLLVDEGTAYTARLLAERLSGLPHVTIEGRSGGPMSLRAVFALPEGGKLYIPVQRFAGDGPPAPCRR